MIVERFRKAQRRFEQQGLAATARWAASSLFYYPVIDRLESRFDRKFGTDTTQPMKRNDFDVDKELIPHLNNYYATPDRTFERFIREERVDYSRYTFVDLGCGKGRALLLASRFPFTKLIGVEIEPALHTICLENIAKYSACVKRALPPIEAVCMNGGDYDFPDGDIFLYLFNPFDEYIMAQMVERLRRAIDSSPRHVRIVYHHPNWVESLMTLPKIRLIREETFHCRASLNNIGRVASYEVVP